MRKKDKTVTIMKKKIAILPKLNDANGNMKSRWFIYFSFRDPKDNVMKRFKIYDGFATIYNRKARYEHAIQQIKIYTDRLKQGWNPYTIDRNGAIYEDNLRYAAAARVFNNARQGNKNFNYYSNSFLPEVLMMADKTYKNYVGKYRMLDNWLVKNGFGENDISTITPEIMQKFFLYLINDQKLAGITLKKYEHMISRLFNWCVKKGYLGTSPMVDLPTTKKRNDQAPRPIHEADINKLVQKIKENDRQLWLTVQLEYYCFLRPGQEIRLARIHWFDLARGIINIPGELVKTREDKIVIIPDQFREYLINEWKLNLFPGDYYLIGKNGMPGPEHLGSNTLRNRFNIIRDSMGLSTQYKLYSWKHTGNARAADAGIPAYHRQMQNGHASMNSMEEYLKNKIGFKSIELQGSFPTL